MTWAMRQGCTPDHKPSPRRWVFQLTRLTAWDYLQTRPRGCLIPCRSHMPSVTCSAPWDQRSSLPWLAQHCLVLIFVQHAKTMKKGLAVVAKKNSVAPAAPGVDGNCAHSRYQRHQE